MFVLSKAKKPRAALRIQEAADKMRPEFRKKFIAAVQRLRDSIDMDAVANALERSPGKAMNLIQAGRLDQFLIDAGYQDAILRTMQAGASASILNLPKQLQVSLNFNLVNPRSVQFIQENQLFLIRGISRTTETSIRNVLLEAFTQGIPPASQARMIRDSIGLTTQQAKAVQNFRMQLEQGTNSPVDATGRTRSFSNVGDRKLTAAERKVATRHIREGHLSQAKIDELVTKYQQRLLNHRANAIARTETIQAAEAGNHEVFMQSSEQGLIDPNTARRRWIVTPDDRLCPICIDIEQRDKKKGGVKLNEPFSTSLGPRLHPPAHPFCRCTVILEIED